MACIPKMMPEELKPLDLKIDKHMDSLAYSLPQGIFGCYYRLTQRTGLKIVRNGAFEDWIYSCGSTVEELKLERCWRLARAEAHCLNKAYRHTKGKYVPKCYGYLPVKIGDMWYAAVKMQHVTGQTLASLGRSWDEDNVVTEKCRKVLRRHWVHQDDLNSSNIIIKMKNNKIIQWKVVDFSPIKSRMYYGELSDSCGGYGYGEG